jgi:sulfoxide reductase heme-binding subunit YedZ
MECLVTVGVSLLVLLSLSDRKWLEWAYRLDTVLGQGALVFLSLTTLPGILRRWQVLRGWQPYLMPIRRHLGIMMYLLALAHAVLTLYLPNWVAGRWLPSVGSLFLVVGMLGLLLATPLFFTANDRAVKKLGRRWGTLHKLVYPLVLLVWGHVLLSGSGWATLAGLILLLEIGSWLKVWYQSRFR